MGGFLSSFLGGGGTSADSQPSESGDSAVVIDFSASWCGPCKMMEPIIHAMANDFTDVEFIKIDVDELS
ncbi:thioredoxin h2, partial [Trifolium medium]|nr:thioredoxin h2 [Trifolium medium]